MSVATRWCGTMGEVEQCRYGVGGVDMKALLANDVGQMHPTAQALVATADELLDVMHMDDITIAAVLEKSGVSHGSMYHHFEDLSDLVEHAVVLRFERGLVESIAALEGLMDATSTVEFRSRAEELLRVLHAQDRRPLRMIRLETLGASTQRPRLASRIARAQQEHLDEQGRIFAEFQRRGWMRNDLDAMAMSRFASATFLGRTVDDVSERPIDPLAWTTTALVALRAVLFGE